MRSPFSAVSLVGMDGDFFQPQAPSASGICLLPGNLHMVLNVAPCGDWEGGHKTLPSVQHWKVKFKSPLITLVCVASNITNSFGAEK